MLRRLSPLPRRVQKFSPLYLLVHGTHAQDDLLALRQGGLGRALLSIVLSNGLHKLVDRPHVGGFTRKTRLSPILVPSIDEENQQRIADSYAHMHIYNDDMGKV